ncbi:helix-turn-helix transcriptional regulator [Actinoplanes subtropicus]|uniref:helix-turn-helix transcriptional regulator n=1 Tax=Actinoplanes subtropicus TaxID=543632 RepID=UPI0004C45727|nr:helix-turn-helix transcriptional regulator [Actinoplanes subtropicus]
MRPISVFETEDLDEAHAMLERTYTRMRLNVTGDEHHLRLARTDLGSLSLHHLTFGMHFDADLTPPDLISVARCRSGRMTRQIGRETLHCGPGTLFLPPPAVRGHVRVEDLDGEYAFFPADIFAQFADVAPGRKAGSIRFTGYRPISAQAAATWCQTYDYVRVTVAGTLQAAESLVADSAVRLLATVALSAFPNTAMHEPTIADRHDAHPANLRRAITFIDENADRDITPADIALAARVTIRALQLAFRRHLDTTPTAYLRRVRLDHAHRQLQAADPALTTVSSIAMRWGFASHSSFTARYHAAYGVPPSETLRRR